MSQTETNTDSFMIKLARFIVDKRKAFYLVFIAAFLFCAASINKVQVNNDITTYLPSETETRRGLTLMDEEFITLQQFHIRVQSDILIKERGENSDGSNENTRNYPCRFTRWNESIRNKQSHADR